jgi:hypothetical protein
LALCQSHAAVCNGLEKFAACANLENLQHSQPHHKHSGLAVSQQIAWKRQNTIHGLASVHAHQEELGTGLELVNHLDDAGMIGILRVNIPISGYHTASSSRLGGLWPRVRAFAASS